MATSDCAAALTRLYEFLDNELTVVDADTIRGHLAACEHCLDQFTLEEHVRAMVKRCCGGSRAPETLRVRVTQVTSTRIILAGD